MRVARPGLMALLLFVAVEAAAQAPSRALAFTPSAVHALNQEREMDLQALDAFPGKRRDASAPSLERQGEWTLIGRLGPMNFTNLLDSDGGGVQATLRRNSHAHSGKIYIGIRRRF